MTPEHPALQWPKVAVIAVTYHERALILIQRGNEPQKHGWGYPGGSVNPGESLHDAACRELLEETQLVAEPEQSFDVIEINEFDADGRHHHYVLIAVLCRYVSGQAVAGDDALACQWVELETILKHPERYIEHVGLVAQKVVARLPNSSPSHAS